MTWLLALAALAADYRGGPARQGEGDGSSLVNNRIAWSRKVGDRLLWPMSPVVEGGVVLVGTSAGTLVALTPDGAPLWTATLGGPVAAPPAVAGGEVYVADGAGGLWALSLGTGAVRWRAGEAKGRVTGAPGVAGGLVVYAGLDRVVRAVRVADGVQAWTVTMPAPAEGAPTIADDAVYLATADGKLRSYSLQDGAARWEVGLGAPSRGAVAVSDGVAVIGLRDGALVGLATRDGQERFRYALGGFVDASPAISGGRAVAASTNGEVHGIEVPTGRRLWSYVAGSPVSSSPTVSGGQVVVGTNGGVVHVVDLATGKGIYQVGVGGPVDGSPAVVDGRAFVGLSDGRVAAIGEPAYVALPPAAGKAAVLAKDAPLWFGRRLYLGAIDQVYAGLQGAASFLVGGDAGLLRSADGGLSWSAAPLPDGERPRQVVRTEGAEVVLVAERSIYRSADGGLSWRREGPSPATWGTGRRVVRSGPKVRLALGDDLLWSGDGGLSWKLVAPPGPVGAAALHPVNPAVLVAAGRDGAWWRTADSGLTWETLPAGPVGATAVGLSEADPARVLAVTAEGSIHRSGDGGLTWRLVAPPAGARATSLAWSPGSASLAYVALADGRVFVTSDGGERWTESRYGLPEDQPIVDCSLDVGADGGVLVAVRLADGGGGAYRLGKVAEHARLEAVTFDTASAVLTEAATPVLDALFARMTRDPALRLRAEGHTDEVGPDDTNLVLSVDRAKAIAAAAEARGIAPTRVLTLGYGESRPVADNSSDAGRAENRRVELYLVRLP